MRGTEAMARHRIQLRVALPVFFCLFVAFTGLTIFFLNYLNTVDFLDRFSLSYLNQAGDVVLEKTINHISPAARMAELNSILLDPGRYQGSYFEAFNDVTLRQLKLYPQFALMYFGSEQGDFWMNAREQDLSISTQVIDRATDTPESDQVLQQARLLPQETPEQVGAVERLISPFLRTLWWHRNAEGEVLRTEETRNYVYDPRWRTWYQNAKNTAQQGWTDAYIFSSSGRLYASGKPGVTVSSPVMSSGRFVGAVGVDIILEELSSFVASQRIGKSGRAFILNGKGETIALKDYSEVIVTGPDGKIRLSHIREIRDKAITDSYGHLRGGLGISGREGFGLDHTVNLRFESDSVRFLACYKPFPADFGPEWYVGIVVPENDFVGDLRRTLLFILAVSVLILAVLILFSLYVSRTITLPIKGLTEEAGRIRDLQVDDCEMTDSIFREIHNLTAAFESMKAGLRSFKKYVPEEIVRYLIRSGEEANLGGQDARVTISFCDISDFTSIAESMEPHGLVIHLAEYMSAFSDILLKHSATVDKYIGDAIMAFWNAPLPIPDHARQACLAALECRSKLAALRLQWRREGKPLLSSRIVVHTGDVVVGNMGSEKRLNYTVVGDAVNLASRLDSLAKLYGTTILVSEDSYREVKEQFAFRKLDKVVVKGRTRSITIYELLGEQGSLSEPRRAFVHIYEAALGEYFRRNWQQAQSLFRKAYSLKPRDKSSALLYRRCGQYAHNPPPPNWDGGFVFTHKG